MNKNVIQLNFDPKHAVQAMNELLEKAKADPKNETTERLFEDMKTLVDLGYSTLSKVPSNPVSGKTKN